MIREAKEKKQIKINSERKSELIDMYINNKSYTYFDKFLHVGIIDDFLKMELFLTNEIIDLVEKYCELMDTKVLTRIGTKHSAFEKVDYQQVSPKAKKLGVEIEKLCCREYDKQFGL